MTQAQYSDGSVLNFNSRNSFIGAVPKHHRTQTSFWDERGILDSYKETDVLLYRGSKGNNGLKTLYEKWNPSSFSNNPTDINETTTISGLLQNKGKFYQRRTTFNTRTGEVDNWQGVSRGIPENSAKWLDSDIWLHARMQSNPEHIAHSVLYQNGLSNVNLSLADNLSSSSGSYFLKEGISNIKISSQANPIEAFQTAIHEATHCADDKAILEYLSTLLKGKTDKEIAEYVSKNTDEIAYIYKKYLAGSYGKRDEIRRISYNKACKTLNETEIKNIIKADENYKSPKENYDSYRCNYLEERSWKSEEIALNQRNFYIEDYEKIFIPDYKPINSFRIIS